MLRWFNSSSRANTGATQQGRSHNGTHASESTKLRFPISIVNLSNQVLLQWMPCQYAAKRSYLGVSSLINSRAAHSCVVDTKFFDPLFTHRRWYRSKINGLHNLFQTVVIVTGSRIKGSNPEFSEIGGVVHSTLGIVLASLRDRKANELKNSSYSSTGA